MLAEYAPLLLMLALAAGFTATGVVVSELLGRRRAGVRKAQTYECGMPLRGDARVRMSVHYYLVALLFILFDVEAVFLVPWAVHAKTLGAPAFAAVAIFLFVLAVGLVYEMRKKALEWDR